MIDRPGRLYLGREFFPSNQQTSDEPFTIALRDLITHAVCLGMTGTGKTGLGISVLEELLLQGIPLIIIDPKGDITNLALTFPAFASSDFKPWLTEDEAAHSHITLDELAARTAQKWREGLAASGIGPERVQALRDRASVRIFTPGSDAGISVNPLQDLNPPPAIPWATGAEILRERIGQICSALLELAGIQADPITSREHILLATLFEAAWRAGQSVDMALLIRMIQDPPINKIGVFDMEVFYPRADRFKLAMALNALMASPSFAAWQSGLPLDISNLLKPVREPGSLNPAGKTPANVFYLAHLDDAERQFFVTLLLSQLVLWMRSHSGTSTLRCLVYFDEVFGYLPPSRNPPTKTPLMTLVKQGRAAGMGIFLATQNPVDLDYKALSNIGTWFIGRLRTERDRARALEGLESAGIGFERETFEAPLRVLPPRTFLVQTASSEPRFLRTRWTMSFLRGPLTREQLRQLNPRAAIAERAPASHSDSPYQPYQASQPSPPTSRQALPPDVREVFLPAPGRRADAHDGQPTDVVYRPFLLASASVRFADRASGVTSNQRYTYLLALNHQMATLDFTQAQTVSGFDVNALARAPMPGARFEPLPPGLTSRWMKRAERALIEHIYRHAVIHVWFNRALRMYGRPDEDQRAFRQRCESIARTKRDADATKVHNQFERRIAALQDRLAREQRELTMDRAELDARKREELLTNIESLFNFVIGRNKRSTGRAVSRGAWKRRATLAAEEDVNESEDVIAKLTADLERIGAEYKLALERVNSQWLAALDDITQTPVSPRKSDIFVDLIALAWQPAVETR
ncbi:MAG: ATP-binding protein [Candidatus Roseilinea sp.]|uniref:ATP-binding protein n=1 Tax=Candidatus Roseilinea sp. TaxID=2838777 RepID=UPI00404B2F93